MKSMKTTKRVGLDAAGVVATGVVVFGVSSLASAETPSPSPSTSYGSGAGPGAGRGGTQDTPVTGDELAKVTAAMKAKDSAVTVSSVRKDPDGSYEVAGRKDAATLFYNLTSDIKTSTL